MTHEERAREIVVKLLWEGSQPQDYADSLLQQEIAKALSQVREETLEEAALEAEDFGGFQARAIAKGIRAKKVKK